MLLEVMLLVYFLQSRDAPSDPMAEETLYDSAAMRRFAGTWLRGSDPPDNDVDKHRSVWIIKKCRCGAVGAALKSGRLRRECREVSFCWTAIS